MSIDYSTADLLKENLHSLPPLPSVVMKNHQEHFIVSFVYNSNAIEGSTLIEYETALVLCHDITIAGKPFSDHLAAQNLSVATEYVFDLSSPDHILMEQDIKFIHSLVYVGPLKNKGVYRPLPVYITGTNYLLPPPVEVPWRMEQLLKSYQEAINLLHPIEAISKFHVDFERIHPFVDGNGRTGRLIMNLELMKKGYGPINLKFIDKEKYYGAFREFELTGDYDPMCQLVLEYVIEELENSVKVRGLLC